MEGTWQVMGKSEIKPEHPRQIFNTRRKWN